MVSAQFLRNVPILRYIKYNYSPIFVFYSLDWMHCSHIKDFCMVCMTLILVREAKELAEIQDIMRAPQVLMPRCSWVWFDHR